MANCATINVKGDHNSNRGIYIHWNGGRGSVAAFILETKKRLGRDWVYREGNDKTDIEADITSFYAVLFGVLREFNSYCSKFKNTVVDGIYMEATDVSNGFGGNGCYTIENDFSCGRLDISSQANQYDYQNIAIFFEGVRAALSAVHPHEQDLFRKIPLTPEEIQEELEVVKQIAANAQARVERLTEKYNDAITEARDASIKTA